MIECTVENIWYKKKRKKKKKFFALFLVFIIIFLAVLYYRSVVLPQIYKTCNDYGKVYAIEATNQAVLTSMFSSADYSDFISIEKNDSGDVVLMRANTQKVNNASRDIEKIAAALLKDKLDKGIDIPVLAFSGINIISGYGKKINFNALTVSSVSCNFVSDFKSVGINQTLHSIYVEIVSVVNLEIPFSNYKSEFTSNALISETVIVGKVPDTYLNGKLFS